MRYQTAVGKLRTLAGACEIAKRWPPEGPLLQAAYTFGDLLSGTDPLDFVQVVVVLNLPPEELPWAKEHRGPGHYPEHDLWEAVEGYLDLHDAAEPPPPAP